MDLRSFLLEAVLYNLSMPLLQSIVEEFDRELARLQALRSIVSGLSRTSRAVARLVSLPELAAEPAERVVSPVSPARQVIPIRRRRADAGQPRGRREPKVESVAEPRALAARVPLGPVVFNPDRLAEERARRAENTQIAAEPAPDLDALSRHLAVRWSMAGTS